MPETQLQVFGIRHHGPGTARALRAGLASFEPDCVLVEGPPDADDLIHWLAHPSLVMPVALLVYRPDEPRRGVFYPFATFSPEFRALDFALTRGIPAGFMDLPRRHTLAVDYAAAMPPIEPFTHLAAAAGHPSYEAWWNLAIEQGGGDPGLFPAVLEMATELRRIVSAMPQLAEDEPGRILALAREACMRRRIRRAAAEGFTRIAVVCGAWHGPALVEALSLPPDDDERILSGLPSAEVAATWVPWTYGRLTQSGGYGAGLTSPGWYDHLWTAGEIGLSPMEMTARWLADAAALLREEGMDTSPGHVIETVRLAEALAAIRERPFPGLPEMEEASLSVMCGGNEEPMKLIRRRLIVGERMGTVPPDVPAVPLQRDLSTQQTLLRLRPEPEVSPLKLDLRREMDLDRSRLLHRLVLLGIPWGMPEKTRGRQVGTYAEWWQLIWTPDLSLRVIEAAVWGNTIRDAAAARAEDIAATTTELTELTQLVDRVLMADLPEAMPLILSRIEEQSALSRDVLHMLATLPPLADVLRYGGLRQTAEHLPLLRRVFDHMLTRACLALPGACVSLDENAAAEVVERLTAAGSAVRLVQDTDLAGRWHSALGQLADRPAVHPIVAGRATRLLHDEAVLRAEGVMTRLERALTPGGSPEVARYAADWLEGFLRDSGLLLVHDRTLWGAIDRWLVSLGVDRFEYVLPFLRRTFSDYPDAVRQQLQERLRGVPRDPRAAMARPLTFDPDRATAVLPTLGRYLGIDPDSVHI